MKSPLPLLLSLLALHSLAAAGLPADELRAKAAEIDRLVLAKLVKEKIQPNAPVSDEAFVRRIHPRFDDFVDFRR